MNKDKILVEIASYRDPELLNTIHSALIQADYPERICFSVCYQGDDTKDLEKLKKIDNCKIKWLTEKETRGSCYARYLCQKMIEDEKYIYQIDSHMRFVKHWDTLLIEDLLSLNDQKAIISFYPQCCTEEMMSLPLDDKMFDEPSNGGIMYTTGFRDENSPFIKILCEPINKTDSRAHTRNAFISGGNFFSFSEVHKEVLHDPKMYFYGDELFMSINLFTHGWNVYNSGSGYIYHQYNRKNQVFPKVKNAMINEHDRFIDVLKHKNEIDYIKQYNIGSQRTIEEFEKFAGIDFTNKTIYLNAETGETENKNYIGKISYLSQKNAEQLKLLTQTEKIEVLIVDVFNDYENCIRNCLDNSINRECISFIVGSTSNNIPSKEKCFGMNIKEFIQFDQESNYSTIVNKISQHVGDNYVAVIDSSVRFLCGWDKYLCKNLKLCGKKGVLTSYLQEIFHNNTSIIHPYINIDMKIKNFKDFLPCFEYNPNVTLCKMNSPQQTPFLYNGFIFMHSNILKKIKYDPNLDYDEQKYIYAIRLWTNGINVYLPKLSYIYRNKNESLLITNNKNLNIVCSLSGIQNYYSKKLEAKYPYDIGNERPLWSWYNFINIKYDMDMHDIVK